MGYGARFWMVMMLVGFCLPQTGRAGLPEITVSISESGGNASEAKTRGLNRAQQTAFYQLLQQVAKGKELELAKRTPPQQIPYFIAGFDILEERSLATSYNASIRYRFNEDAVRRLIEDSQGLAPDVAGNSLLVIPLYDEGEGVLLWEEGNRWRELFNEAALEKGRDDVLVPFGDSKDKLLLDNKSIFSRKKAPFVKMAERYGAKNIVLALAHLVQEDGKPATLEVIIRRATASKADDSRLYFTPEPGEDTSGLMRRAALKVAMQLASSAETFALDYNPDRKLKGQVVRVEFAYPAQWLELKQALEQVPGVEYSTIGAAGPNFTQMILYFRGPKSALQQSLVSKGLHVAADKEFWVVGVPQGGRL